MRINLTHRVLISATVCLFLFSGILKSQSFRFKNYGEGSGIPSSVVYTIVQDNSGYLWTGTAEGLAKFDGIEFHNISFPDSAENRYPTSSLRDKNGTLWFGCNDGTVFHTAEGKPEQIKVSNTSGISSIIEGPDGLIWVLPQKKPVFSINPLNQEDIQEYSLSADPVISSGCFSADGDLIIGTLENIMVCKASDDSISVLSIVEGFDYSRIMAIHRMDDGNSFLIGTDGNGLFQLELNGNENILSRVDGPPELATLAVRAIMEDNENVIWISTAESGVIRYSSGKVRIMDESSGLASDNVSCVYQDLESNIWMGFNGGGLSLLGSDAISFYSPGRGSMPDNVIYINVLGDKYFLGTPSGYYLFDPLSGEPGAFKDLSGSTGRSDISSYFIDTESNIWIATRGSGLFKMDNSGRVRLFYRSEDTGENNIMHIEMDQENIWLATLNGLILLDRADGEYKNNYNINTGLPHNYINQVALASDGSALVACESDRLYRVDAGSGVEAGNVVISGRMLNKILAVTVARDSGVWAATSGNGAFWFYGDSVKSLTVSDGLLSNYCYSIYADSESNVWIGHSRGFSVYNSETGMVKVYDTDFAGAGDCNADGLFESPDGKVLIGTTRGLIVYDRQREKKTQVPPFNNINSVTINNVEYPYQQSITLPYKKSYSVKISFVGISFSNPEKVFYSTFMENFDADWSGLSSNREVAYSLRDGRYKFNIVSVNEDGLSQETPVMIDILIKKPFWRSWWFVLSVIAFVSGTGVLIVSEREKAQKKIREYLEKELEARTEVVMKQKNEIELQNIEITDSINYAKRIQSSILPDLNKLRSYFDDAFITFYPRDIVSGDFYWFDEIDDGKFILVCADSTGHGVPGAFMSVIGSTLLRDIVSRQRISKPSEILSKLDKQIFSTLNQNLELGISNDGMDVVVCEFTRHDRHVRFASAMRPVIIVIDGEILYIKGNRSSVGGESANEKFFDDQEYYLNKGDTIYLFSDGLPDQFGGPDGKKMKIARLKQLIEDISKMPMKEQSEEVSRFYHEWKGPHDQVDDIIFMGVRV